MAQCCSAGIPNPFRLHFVLEKFDGFPYNGYDSPLTFSKNDENIHDKIRKDRE